MKSVKMATRKDAKSKNSVNSTSENDQVENSSETTLFKKSVKMATRKHAKSKNSVTSTSENDHGGEIHVKESTVKFPESNVHLIPIELTSWFSKTSNGTAVLDFKNAEIAKSQVREALKKYSTILLALGASAGFLSILDTQITRKIGQSETSSNTLALYTGIQISARSAISILSIATAVYLYMHYSQIHTLKVLRNIIPPESGFWFSRLALQFFVELTVCCMHIPPGTRIFPEEAQLIVFSRFYLIVRFLKQKHKLKNSKSTRFIASVTKTDMSSSVFLLKIYFLRKPFILVIGTYLITILVGGFAVYVVEKNISFLDTIWMLIVTMTTVGFGDFVPYSLIARTVTAATAIIGVFLMALCINLVNDSLQLTQQEKRILACSEKTENQRKVRDTAARAIQCWWKYSRLLRKGRRRSSAYRAYHKIRATKMKEKLYEIVHKWRRLQKEKKDDYWRKEFLGDNTAMLLTDVAREVKSIKEFLEDGEQAAPNSLENVVGMQTRNEASLLKRPLILPKLATLSEVPVSVQNPSTLKTHQHLVEGTQRDTIQHHSGTDNLVQQKRLQKTACISKSTSGGDSSKKYSTNSSPDNNMKTIESTIMLLQSQIRLMNNNLDEMYSKSKQELTDLEHHVKCVVQVCSNSQIEAPLCSNCRKISKLKA